MTNSKMDALMFRNWITRAGLLATAMGAAMTVMIVTGLLTVALPLAAGPAIPVINIEMKASIDPSTQSISVKSHYHVDLKAKQTLTLDLASQLVVKVLSADVVTTDQVDADGVRRLRVQALKDVFDVSIESTGVFNDSVNDGDSSGIISQDGAVLFGGTNWYPRPVDPHRFKIEMEVPLTWTSVTSGELDQWSSRTGRTIEQWTIDRPQEALDWVTGPYNVDSVTDAKGHYITTHFHQTDPALSKEYLTRIPDFIAHYEKEIGPYPYTRFSVVENLWETGFGMGGFTLLGPSVMRLPFIFTTSLPHEILHNWWGNSVYVDYDSGNWCEGLTTYMGDHWQQELQGTAAEYRRTTLAGFGDYAAKGRDFPLREFRGRHSASTQAVGYGKGMMLFHMLKVRFGEDVFRRAMQRFYSENLYRRASWAEIQSAFEAETGQSLAGVMGQWLNKTGAAALSLSGASKSFVGGQWLACMALDQDTAKPFIVDVPIEMTWADGTKTRSVIAMTSPSQLNCLPSAVEPKHVDVDPKFEVFRELKIEERPPALSAVMAGETVSVAYEPALVDVAVASEFVKSWTDKIEGKIQPVVIAGTIQSPVSGTLVLLGDTALNRAYMQGLVSLYQVKFDVGVVTVGTQRFDLRTQSVAIAARDTSGIPVLWIGGPALRVGAANLSAVADLAGRMSHYGKFGALVFDGKKNLLKSTWPILSSPMGQDF